MSLVKDAKNDILSRLATLFPDKVRIADPYNINENSELQLNDGFGVTIEDASNTNREIACHLSIRRSFGIILTKKFFSTELCDQGRQDAYDSLLDEHDVLVQNFEKLVNLEGLVTSFLYVSDGGIESVFNEKDQFFFIKSNFDLEYLEVIT